MNAIERALGGIVAAAAAAGLAWASSAPVTVRPSSDAVLRLAWSAVPERVETCREQSQEALANLPRHMRQAVVCEGTTARYRLEVRFDGTLVASRLVEGGGLRRDRRLYVFEELPLGTGERQIDVRFERVEDDEAPVGDAGGAARGSDGEDDEPSDDRRPVRSRPGVSPAPRAAWVPPSLSLATRLGVSPREVVLVTYDPQQRTLVLRRRNAEP